ncbi:MAG: hypothetical protein LUE27_10160 [Clostridia bacterium]|nr:hypothetical protein [Clostridia bacterium]
MSRVNDFLMDALFTAEDLKKYYEDESELRKNLDTLVENGRVRKVAGDLYGTVNPLTEDIYADKYELAAALYPGSCCAYHTAMEYHWLTVHDFDDVQLACAEPLKTQALCGLRFEGYVTDIHEGVAGEFRNSYVRVTDMERTIIDCTDRMDLCGGLEEVRTAYKLIISLDEERFLKYLEIYNKGILYKKCAYMLSRFYGEMFRCSMSPEFYDVCRQNMSAEAEHLDEAYSGPCVYDKEWKLYVPAEWEGGTTK